MISSNLLTPLNIIHPNNTQYPTTPLTYNLNQSLPISQRIVGSYSNTCMITLADDRLSCWGLSKLSEKPLKFKEDTQQVAVGLKHICALKQQKFNNITKSMHQVKSCWGDNSYDQLYIDLELDYSYLSLGIGHTCGKAVDNTYESGVIMQKLVCQGRIAHVVKDEGEEIHIPQDLVFNVDSFQSGNSHVCVITKYNLFRNKILQYKGSVFCYGENSSGECDPPGYNYIISDDEPFSSVTSSSPPSPSTSESTLFHTIALGDSFTCGINYNIYVICFGTNQNKQLESPQWNGLRRPFLIEIQSGLAHSFVSYIGTQQFWGYNKDEQAVDKQFGYRDVEIFAGGFHNCIWDKGGGGKDGYVKCQGQNQFGQCDVPDGVLNIV